MSGVKFPEWIISTTSLDGTFKKPVVKKSEQIKSLEIALQLCKEQRDAAYLAVENKTAMDWDGTAKDWTEEDNKILEGVLHDRN